MGGVSPPNFSNAFLEEYDDFLGINAGGQKLGWSVVNFNGWSSTVSGNRFPGACGVVVLGLNGTNTGPSDYSHLRLGSFPFIPQLSEGYSNLEFQGVIGLHREIQTQLLWSSRFGLLDTGNGFGTNSSILISAEYFDGAYNWIATWKDGSGGPVNHQIITLVQGDLNVKLFTLRIKIDCQNHKILFSVDGTEKEVLIPTSNWLFGAMSPIFYISRRADWSPGRTMWIDKFLFKKNSVV